MPNTYKQVRQFPIKTGWQGAPLALCNLLKAFKHNTICDGNGIQTHNIKFVNEHSTFLQNWSND